MSLKTSLVFKILNVVFWLIFIGLCIKTGALLTSFFVSMVINSAAAKNLYPGLDLFGLFEFSRPHYFLIVFSVILQTGLKAYISYLIVRFFLNFKLSSPFEADVSAMIFKISHFSFLLGVLALISDRYMKKLMEKGVSIVYEWGAGEILFFSGFIYILAEVFKKGTEIRSENDLTI
jgi:hypothetical protein